MENTERQKSLHYEYMCVLNKNNMKITGIIKCITMITKL